MPFLYFRVIRMVVVEFPGHFRDLAAMKNDQLRQVEHIEDKLVKCCLHNVVVITSPLDSRVAKLR